MTVFYCNASEVRDDQLQKLVTDTYLQDTDNYIQDLALRCGLKTSQIKVPLTYTAKKLALAFLCKSIAQDKIGVNVQANGYGVEVDLYKVKWTIWNREFERLEPQVTAEVLTNEADTAPEFASTGIQVYRG